MFKKPRLNEDAGPNCLDECEDWQPDIIQRMVSHASQDIATKRFSARYDFTVQGFTQRVYRFEVERKAYGTLQMKRPDANIAVIVKFVVVSGVDYCFAASCDVRQNPDTYGYQNDVGWFFFNAIKYKEEIGQFLDIQIVLLPKQWEIIKEWLWLAKWQNSCPTMGVRVEYPVNPDPGTIVKESIQQPFRVSRFWIDSVVAFDSKSLSTNLPFRADIGI